MPPETKYTRSGDINLAYQVVGQKGEYLVFIPGWVSNIEECWNIPQLAAWLKYLASFSKLVLFDKRGTGLSDTVNENALPNLKQRADDLRIILSAIGVSTANFLGLSEGGPLAVHLAANYPNMVSKLILVGSFSKWIKSEDYPFGHSEEQHQRIKQHIFEHWGEPVGLNLMAPSVANDQRAQNQWASFLRRSASPKTAKMFYEMNIGIDVRENLEKVTCPTLLLHRKQDSLIEYGHSKFMHEQIPNSQFLLSEGSDHLPWFGIQRNELMAIQTFLTDGKAVTDSKLDSLNIEDIFKLYEIKDHIQNNFQEDISIKDLCKEFGINDYKVKLGFKALFQTPVIGFLTTVRLEKACELLMDPKETVASIAEKVGYTHANNFSVAFKRQHQMTPMEYRNKML
ncbi:alpha/beta fold hydrolase [Flagellimonas nanhaiensis]|uniref:Alpha/beta fold hydrolase n=1 Tax=Flagellimonas nanhaiensis TaxID=2292706 RepID=A0A371JSG7_9FLAO|nr:alpha/beta fold hydrolase [Allomuricauda nanhaiensis]RDY60757.1 alpha/beta fold hydrolase [Allomuricauda nanhaiensis]